MKKAGDSFIDCIVLVGFMILVLAAAVAVLVIANGIGLLRGRNRE